MECSHCVLKMVFKKIKIFFYFKLIFFIFLDYFDMLMLKIIFLKKYYFDVFSNKKYFEYHNLFVIWSVSYFF